MAFEHGKVNRDKVRNRVETSGDAPSKVLEFKPRKGTSQLRVLPPHPESDIWYQGSKEHYLGRGHGYAPCPRQFNNPCPVCEKGEELYSSGDEAKIRASDELRPRDQFFYNVVLFSTDNGDFGPQDGVVVMRTGIKVLRQLKELDNDEAGGWGDMTNPETGFEVRITRKGETRNDTEYNVTPVRTTLSLRESLQKHDVNLDSLTLVNLSEYVRSSILTYDEMKARLQTQQVAPGFPGGPRKTVQERQVPETFKVHDVPESDGSVTFEGELPPPPVVTEE